VSEQSLINSNSADIFAHDETALLTKDDDILPWGIGGSYLFNDGEKDKTQLSSKLWEVLTPP